MEVKHKSDGRKKKNGKSRFDNWIFGFWKNNFYKKICKISHGKW